MTYELKRQGGAFVLNKAARLVKIRQGTLRAMLAEDGRIRPEKRKGSPIEISREDVARLAENVSDSIRLSEIGSVLGIGYRIVRILRESGELPTWFSKTVKQRRDLFRLSDLERWVSEIIGNVPEWTSLPEGCIDLANAPNRTHVPTLVLLEAIKLGKVRVLATMINRPKFGGAILNIDEVFAVVPSEIRRRLSERRSGPRGPYKKSLAKNPPSFD